MEVQKVSLFWLLPISKLTRKRGCGLNNNMVPRSEWESTVLKDNDDVIVIKAV